MSRSMVTTKRHSIRVTPQFIELCDEYTQHYIRCCQSKIEEYRSEVAKQQSAGLRPIVEIETFVIEARTAIARATVVQEGLRFLRNELECIYDWHFKQLAEVYRRTRIELGLARIDDSPDLRMSVTFTMGMLKSENPTFSEQKFINYINN